MLSVQFPPNQPSIFDTIETIEVQNECYRDFDNNTITCNHFCLVTLKDGSSRKIGLSEGHIWTLLLERSPSEIKISDHHHFTLGHYDLEQVADSLKAYNFVKSICESGAFTSETILTQALAQPIFKKEDLLKAANEKGLDGEKYQNVLEAIEEGVLEAPSMVLAHRAKVCSHSMCQVVHETGVEFLIEFFKSKNFDPFLSSWKSLPDDHWLTRSQNTTVGQVFGKHLKQANSASKAKS